MKHINRLMFLVMFSFMACTKCYEPNDNNKVLRQWQISPSEDGSANSARELEGGIIQLGADPASIAQKTFECGNGKNCNISMSLSQPTSNRDNGEGITIVFESPGRPARSITYNSQPHNPVRLSFPFCGPMTVTIRGNEGRTPGMDWQNVYRIGPIYYDCMDCVLEEKDAQGN